MDTFKGLEFVPFTQSDIAELTPIMKRSFDEDTRRHLNQPHGGPDGYDNGDFLKKWFIGSGSDAYKIAKDGRAIGAINVWINKDKINTLGCMFLDTGFQDCGVGTTVWEYIEAKYPDTAKWRTETPVFSRRNHNFYINKCGFHAVRIEDPQSESGGQFILEKTMR